MRIQKVLYKRDDSIEEIYLNEIESRDDIELIKRNLFCAFGGCSAKMEYVPRGVRVAHFRTWPKVDHTEDCKDFFKREEKRKSKKNLATTSARLTDKHINNVLKNLIKYTNETEEQKRLRLEKQRKRYKEKKSQIVDTTTNSLNVLPTTDKSISGNVENSKEPPVKKRYSISDLNEEDLNTAIAIHDNILSIKIEVSRVVILLGKDRLKLNVFFEEDFFATAAKNIMNMFEVVNDALEQKQRLTLDCVGNVEKRNGDLSIVVTGQNHIRINQKTIERFTFEYSNPNYK